MGGWVPIVTWKGVKGLNLVHAVSCLQKADHSMVGGCLPWCAPVLLVGLLIVFSLKEHWLVLHILVGSNGYVSVTCVLLVRYGGEIFDVLIGTPIAEPTFGFFLVLLWHCRMVQ